MTEKADREIANRMSMAEAAGFRDIIHRVDRA